MCERCDEIHRGLRFYKGVVEDRNDPLKQGRCRVRIIGIHTENLSDIPTKDLPWATPLHSITSAGVSGKGHTPLGPVEGTIVLCVFNDEHNMQDPIMIGTLGGKPAGHLFPTRSNQKTTKGQRKAVFNNGVDPDTGEKVDPLQDMDKLEGRDVDLLIIHCTATKPSQDIGVDEVDVWHRANGWAGCGYHAVIRRNGVIEGGRALGTVGAHAQGYNSRSVGVSLVGGINENGNPEDNFTTAQMASLRTYVAEFLTKAPDAKVIGHNQVSSKACPSFDVQAWLTGNFDDAKGDAAFIAAYPSGPTGNGSPLTASATDKHTDTGRVEAYSDDVTAGKATRNTNYPENSFGFVDPNGTYPKDDYTEGQEPDTNRLSRNEDTDKTIVQTKKDNRETTIRGLNGATYAEPVTPYAAKYPYNHVTESESGHIFEVDDTPGAERLHRYHKSGTFEEIHPDGTRVTKIVGPDYLIIEQDGNVFIKGNLNITVEGNANLIVEGNANIETDGKFNVLAQGDINMVSRNNVKIIGKRIDYNP